MSSQTAVSDRPSPARTSPCWESEADDLEAAFIYADDSLSQGNARGYVDCRGDVYDAADRWVGHVTAAVEDGGQVYRGYDEKLGYVRVALSGDGYVYAGASCDANHGLRLRGVVTARGEIYRGRCACKVGIAKPPLDAKRIGAAALLLGLV